MPAREDVGAVTRACGHIPDRACDVEEDLRTRHVGMLVGASVGALPAAVDYSSLLDGVQDQKSSSSCVGQAFATAIYLRAKIAGHPIARPSAKAIYDVARLSEQRDVLVDDGCRPRAAIDGMTEHGLVASERWPLTDTNVNELPPLDVFRAGVGATLSNHYRIASGSGCSLLMKSALAKGFPVPYSQPVDDGYLEYSGGIWRGMDGPTRGGHMQVALGYDVLYGTPYFLVAGSWGTSFGVDGFALIAESFFESGLARDILVPTTIPTVIR